MTNQFTATERRELLDFVRSVIASRFGGETPAVPEIPRLRENGSCFVTLHLGGELRGCIGSIEAFELLGQSLRRNALNAAFEDPRFPPLAADELPEITLEISVLTPLNEISSPEEFVVGRDGIIMRLHNRGAVFLPQVAPEQGWDRETTLSYLARKAGLPGNAWRDPGARFFTFQAEVFSEDAI